MKTVAFLQNMWVRDPERVKQMLADGVARFGEKYRHRLTATFLFAGCQTGRRLRRELGDRCESILWEEASREVLGNPRDVPVADLAHITTVIRTEEPQLVLAFGAVARAAILPLAHQRGVTLPHFHLIGSPHPAARSNAAQRDFRDAMAEARRVMDYTHQAEPCNPHLPMVCPACMMSRRRSAPVTIWR